MFILTTEIPIILFLCTFREKVTILTFSTHVNHKVNTNILVYFNLKHLSFHRLLVIAKHSRSETSIIIE